MLFQQGDAAMTSTPSIRSFPDNVLSGGRDLARRGQDLAAYKLGVGDDPAARSQMRNTALASGTAAGVMGSLWGRAAVGGWRAVSRLWVVWVIWAR